MTPVDQLLSSRGSAGSDQGPLIAFLSPFHIRSFHIHPPLTLAAAVNCVHEAPKLVLSLTLLSYEQVDASHSANSFAPCVHHHPGVHSSDISNIPF